MHIHNCIDSPSLFLSPLLSQPAVLITQLRQVIERKERLQTQGRSTPKPACSLHANSQSQRSWHQRVMLAHPVPFSLCQGGLERKAPVLQTSKTPQHPAHAISRFKLCLLTQKFKYTICNNSDIKDERRGLD